MWYQSSCFEDPSSRYIQTAFSCQLRVWSSPLYLLSFPPRCTGSHEPWTCKADTGMTKALRSLNWTSTRCDSWPHGGAKIGCLLVFSGLVSEVVDGLSEECDGKQAAVMILKQQTARKKITLIFSVCVAGRTLHFLVIFHSKSQKNSILHEDNSQKCYIDTLYIMVVTGCYSLAVINLYSF